MLSLPALIRSIRLFAGKTISSLKRIYYIFKVFMHVQQTISLFWFRRDLRLQDNTGLIQALKGPYPVLPVFIFDKSILENLENNKDARVTFIYNEVCRLQKQLRETGGSMLIMEGYPLDIFKKLSNEFTIGTVFSNRDYEPYAKKRDFAIQQYLKEKGIPFHSFKDQVLFEGSEILSGSGIPYKVFTPYSRSWMEAFQTSKLHINTENTLFSNFYQLQPSLPPPSLASLGFQQSHLIIPPRDISESRILQYDQKRDYPCKDASSRLGIHLRFGTISIRDLVAKAWAFNKTFLQELIWREFYMMILDNHPYVTERALKPAYNHIPWRNNEEDFQKWCQGRTGIPLVDAGMRQLNETGFMHNRVRMITASFLSKNLLTDWRWGEAYFAEKLLDYELASNNGGWQWAAGSGVDAQPYFRVFNPESQAHKFDPEFRYIKRWIPEFGTDAYPAPMVNLKESRAKAIAHYKKHLHA
jgi:deoxyribodipyrimidine photo-lyase